MELEPKFGDPLGVLLLFKLATLQPTLPKDLLVGNALAEVVQGEAGHGTDLRGEQRHGSAHSFLRCQPCLQVTRALEILQRFTQRFK